MSDTNDMRKDFQAWANTLDLDLKRFNDGYSDCNTDYAWSSWQAATERATPKWISVTDAAPCLRATVLICTGNTPSSHRTLGYLDDRNTPPWRYEDGELCRGVTHWMPIPPPPAIRQGGAT